MARFLQCVEYAKVTTNEHIASELIFFESHLNREVPIYSQLARFLL